MIAPYPWSRSLSWYLAKETDRRHPVGLIAWAWFTFLQHLSVSFKMFLDHSHNLQNFAQSIKTYNDIWPYLLLLLIIWCVMLVWCWLQAERSASYPRVHVDFALTSPNPFIASSPSIDWTYHSAEEEIRSVIVKTCCVFIDCVMFDRLREWFDTFKWYLTFKCCKHEVFTES